MVARDRGDLMSTGVPPGLHPSERVSDTLTARRSFSTLFNRLQDEPSWESDTPPEVRRAAGRVPQDCWRSQAQWQEFWNRDSHPTSVGSRRPLDWTTDRKNVRDVGVGCSLGSVVWSVRHGRRDPSRSNPMTRWRRCGMVRNQARIILRIRAPRLCSWIPHH